MADLVLGLAKSAVEGTLSAAKSAIEEEEKLKKSMQRDLMLISDEFEMMHSFLNVARERASDQMVSTLVRQVRNMALDVEDCIETVVLMDIKSHWWRRLLPYCMVAMVPATALDDAVASIEMLKSRVEAMGQRNERYMHSIGVPSSSKPSDDETARQQAVADAKEVGILIEAREAKKRDGNPRDLVDFINRIHPVFPLQVVSVWGTVGDLGVASIIRKTCDDPEIRQKFKCRAWVKLTHPFNPHEFIRGLMAQFYTNYCPRQGGAIDLLKRTDEMMAMAGARLTEEFAKQVSDNRCLVFLEGVSSTAHWEAVRVCLPDTNNGSCVFVHTQQLEVASLVAGQSHRVLELEQFSADHSVCAFFNEKKSNRKILIELIVNKNAGNTPRQVISLCGEVGDVEVAPIINKTCDDEASIINKTCDDDLPICNNFRYRAWVKLMHPFNQDEFARILLAQLCANYCPQHGSAEDFLKLKGMMVVTEGILIREFMKQLMSDQRYLVFLEDVTSKDDWEAVRTYLPDKTNGSCIVVHTKQQDVAGFCVGGSHRSLELDSFSTGHPVCLFFNENTDEDVEKAIKKEAAKKWLEEFEIFGRQADIWYLNDNYRSVRPVYGIAGVGKSYIVKHVYCKQVIAGSFQKYGWVDVSHPFNVRDFSWSLLLDLHSGSLQHGSMLRIKDPIQDCRELLRQHECLIVIDGLGSTEEWDLIKAALVFEHNKRHRIIVITQEESVAKYCSKNNRWNVEGLKIEDAYDLFTKRASKNEWSSWPREPSPADIDKAKVILNKCGGLPQVVVAVGDFVGDGWRLLDSDHNLMWVLETHPALGTLRGLFDWVRSYFHSCPDRLKPCIFYLSIFPVNHKIRWSRLVRRWIAEGYSRDTRESTAKENGAESFLKLCELSMIHVPGSASMPYMMRRRLCQVNGFFREYIISRSMEENLVFELKEHCRINSQHTGRHLTIGSTWDRDKSVYRSIDFTRLRSLTVFGTWESFFISDKMRLLRVLDLEGATSVTDGDVQLMVKLLPRLKFLSLRGRREITHLPDSLDSLRQLQTLDIRHTSVATLPLSITKLQKLQHICAGNTVQMDYDTDTAESLPSAGAGRGSVSSSTTRTRPRAVAALVSRLRLQELCTSHHLRHSASPCGGVEAPRGIGKMVALNSISVIDVSVASGQAILEELKNLTQLRKLGVCGVKWENCHKFCAAVSGHPHLESLSVWLDKNQGGSLDAISPPPKQLQSLKLCGHVGKLPAWIKPMSNLRKLKLRLTMITQYEVDLLKDLPSLSTLCLYFMDFQYGELRFRGSGCFCQLLLLEIGCNCRLQSITFESLVMSGLEVLEIHCSNVSSLRFSGLKELFDLREVSLSGSYDDKVKQHLQRQLHEHQREIKPVLKLN
ncbi:disease resistance protein Pik-2-like [Panicum virgatum]|uniref:Disease resistance protein RPM1 n=1 Tax=Panicum virgatum TaxID=38727 RepID=A0A8T0TU93_PANVG|nr:disease resistance protein Pik-2-like [Panicum virgatum]KAG2611409.1 hypothetical protein PVAP13_4KG163700 [Panicum virgatum]